jgi:hypothetical protein
MLELPSSLSGMNRYAKHLELSEAKDPKRRAALTKQYCRGWFIGSKEVKKALAKDMAEKHPDVDWEGARPAGIKRSTVGRCRVRADASDKARRGVAADGTQRSSLEN